jgi:hypothetical protein
VGVRVAKALVDSLDIRINLGVIHSRQLPGGRLGARWRSSLEGPAPQRRLLVQKNHRLAVGSSRQSDPQAPWGQSLRPSAPSHIVDPVSELIVDPVSEQSEVLGYASAHTWSRSLAYLVDFRSPTAGRRTSGESHRPSPS